MENEEIKTPEGEQAEDLLPEELTEEPEDNSEDLASILGADEGSAEQPQETQQPQGTGGELKEPGYVKSRIQKAVDRAVAEMEARFAPLQEKLLEMEAKELVQSGKVKDLELAKELVRYRQGRPQTAPAAESQPRNENGQFAPRQQQPTSDPATSARIDMLQHQADRIKAANGPDVIAEFRNNEEIRQKVISGELDFYDVAEQMRAPKRNAPSPMRSPNGASGSQRTAIDNMSDEQFERMEKRISEEGARYSLR